MKKTSSHRILKGSPTPEGTLAATLAPNERNPRRMSNEAKERLRESLHEFGPLDGFVWNERTKRLVSAHQRHSILPPDAKIRVSERLEMPNLQGTTARGYVEFDGERIPYREVRWDETKEKAAMLAANKHSGEWDDRLLAELLAELQEAGADTDLTGFPEDEIDKLLEKAGPKNQDQPEAGDLFEHYDYIVLFFKSELDLLAAHNHFGIEKSKVSRRKKNNIGTGRVIDGAAYLERLANARFFPPKEE